MQAVFGLKPGDVVEYLLEHYTVEGRATYTSASRSWTESVLNPGIEARRLTMMLLNDRLYIGEPCHVEGTAGDGTVVADGQQFSLESSGRADARWVYEGGATRFDRPTYWHYETTAGEMVEMIHGHLGQWAMHYEISDPSMFEVFGT